MKRTIYEIGVYDKIILKVRCLALKRRVIIFKLLNLATAVAKSSFIIQL